LKKEWSTLLESLKTQIGLHRQLLEIVRIEHQALVDADMDALEKAIHAKEGTIGAIQREEIGRKAFLSHLTSVEHLTLTQLIEKIQAHDLPLADEFRKSQITLNLLSERIREQNSKSRQMVESSLQHVEKMKRNIIGEKAKNSETYTAKGQRSSNPKHGRNLLVKEI
jgi:predicted phage tail protein